MFQDRPVRVFFTQRTAGERPTTREIEVAYRDFPNDTARLDTQVAVVKSNNTARSARDLQVEESADAVKLGLQFAFVLPFAW